MAKLHSSSPSIRPKMSKKWSNIFLDKSWLHLTLDTNKFDFSNNHSLYFCALLHLTSFNYQFHFLQKKMCDKRATVRMCVNCHWDICLMEKNKMGTEPLWHDVVIRHWVKIYFTVQCPHPRTSRNVPHAPAHAPAHAPWFLGDRTCTCTRTRTRTFHYYLC